ncbi:MAG: Rho termination factor N-terminal domain-containing protein [Candidatus Cyclobacteriaceae bacterium M3_2C_046]
MRGKLEKSGNYELFQTTKGSQILNLNDKYFYAVVEGQRGDILVGSDEDHQKQKTLKKGTFYMANFDDDPEFTDLPHLFLQEGSKFREWILPNDYPTKDDYQKKLVKTNDLVSRSKVEKHVKGDGNVGSEKQYQGKPERLRTKSKKELYKMAQDQQIEGMSKMNKEELVQKLAD